MNQFSIRDIENLTNIKAHTLRIWEQRYQLLCPQRKASRHRLYSNEDLKLILRVSYLYHKGLKISHIVRLRDDEIRNLALGDAGAETEELIFINRMTEASVDLNTEGMEQALEEAIEEFGFSATMLEVVFPFLHKIGLLWLTGHIVPAQEHFASNVIIRRILMETDKLPPARVVGRRVLLFTPPGEYHEIPILLMRYLLLARGEKLLYAGTGVPVRCLESWCRRTPVTDLLFMLITPLPCSELNTYLKNLRQSFPQLPLFCGSGTVLPADALPAYVRQLRNRNEFLAFVNNTIAADDPSAAP